MAFIIIVSLYCALLLTLMIGFARLHWSSVSNSRIHFISVIVPFRNETKTLPVLLNSLEQIQYPKDKWEIILVDDHSTDGFQDVRVISSQSHGKKAAITTGVESAKGDIIVTTDADCRVHPLWLEKINLAFQDPNIQMMIGGVRIQGNRSFFSQLQSMEFVSVAVTGAATLGFGFPTMANGANLSYRRSAFVQYNEKISSGDDEFLMNRIHRSFENSVGYLYSKEAVVTTAPSSSVNVFVEQRLRWAGKWKSNISLSTRIFALVVWLFHVAFISMGVSAIVGFIPWRLFVILASTKIFVEALLLIPAAKFYQVKWSWISFLVLQFIYSFYVITVGFMSQIFSPRWKGREVKTKV